MDNKIIDFLKDKKSFRSEILEEIKKTYPEVNHTILDSRIKYLLMKNHIDAMDFCSPNTKQYLISTKKEIV